MRVIVTIIGLTGLLYLSIALSGCSFKTEIGWHGETAVNDRKYTQEKVK